MMRKIELVDYEVDEAMLGEFWNEDGTDDLIDFCNVLQELCKEKCLFFEIIPITDSCNGATNNYRRMDTMEQLFYVDELIPWNEAINKYMEDK